MRVTVLLFGCVLLLGGCAAPGPAAVTNGDLAASREEALMSLDFREVVKSAKQKVFPAVVFINCVRESLEGGRKVTEEVMGSGVIVSPRGEVLSNWHVVDKAVEVRCLLYDSRHYDAEVLGTDKDTDLSLLQLKLTDKDADLPFASLGDSESLTEGSFVMAMGAPWGMNRSVSIGIVACTKRFLQGSSEYSLWLQTDAQISPGNSGGPLVDTHGRVVGINTRGGGGLGFAIPASTIQIIADQLREFHRVNWSWTGLQLQPLNDFRKKFFSKATDGIFVAGTDPESPARHAGILAHDRIVKVNGQPVTATWEEDVPAVRRLLGMLEKGKPATLDIDRDGKAMSVTLTPREKGKVEGEELDCPRWNMTVKAINQFDNPDLYAYHPKGVFIYGVKYPGNAANSRLQEKDIILKIGGQEVNTLDDVRKIHKEALANIDKEHRILFTVERGGMMKQYVLDFQRDFEKE